MDEMRGSISSLKKTVLRLSCTMFVLVIIFLYIFVRVLKVHGQNKTFARTQAIGSIKNASSFTEEGDLLTADPNFLVN